MKTSPLHLTGLALAGLFAPACIADIQIDADLDTTGATTLDTDGGSTGGECFDDADCGIGAVCQGGVCFAVPQCGNGIIDQPWEQCDDGNQQNGDGCDGMCQVEPVAVCGDGIVDVGEECDDGNLTNGDGCDAQCYLEPPPPVVCGDGIQAGGELCLEQLGLISGNAPTRVGLADMNQDGALDVVVGWYGDSRVQVFRNAGDGQVFFGDSPANLSGRPEDLDLGDMDGDGFTDVVVATDAARVFVYSHSGGTLIIRNNITASGQPTDMGVGDVDNDGIQDIVVANAGGAAQVMRGLGSWSFSIQPSVGLGWISRDMKLADVNLDGYADAVFTTSNDTLAVFQGASGANLLPTPQVPTLIGASPLAVADADQDGWPDAFSSEGASNAVSTFQNMGGTFVLSAISYAGAPGTSSLGVGDLDDDGWPDLVTSTNSTLELLRGDGTGEFSSTAALMTGAPASDLAFGDLDGDGRTDVVAALTGANAVRIFLNRP